jgi:beta-galactosidase
MTAQGTLLTALALLSLPVTAQADPRTKISLNESWRFLRQDYPGSAVESRFREAPSPGYDDSGWTPVFLPHSWDRSAHSPWVALNHWRGVGWYRRHFRAPARLGGRRVHLEFEGAFQVAHVWVNGSRAGEHTGGYTGFEFDITHLVKPAGDNVLVVSLDSTNSPDIPPANEENVSMYGGLYRNVWLKMTSSTYVPEAGISITTPQVSTAASSVRVITKVKNASRSAHGLRIVSSVLSKDGSLVAEVQASGQAQAGETVALTPGKLTVAFAKLWHPDHPDLYTLRTSVYSDGALSDEVSTRFGFRVMGYLPGKGYTINGEFINIHGVDRRQDYGYLGDAVPDAINRHDMEIIKQLGANFVRTAHYVQSKSVVDAADELGILLWEEIPNIKIYDYSPAGANNLDVRYTRKYIDNCLLAIQEMIGRDKNHPSVIMWGIGDDLTGYPYLEDLKEMNDQVHALDPTRWTAGRVYPLLTDVKDPTNQRYFNFLELSQQHPDWKWLWNEWGAYVNERGVDIDPKPGPAGRADTGNVDEYSDDAVASEITAAIFQEATWLKLEAMPWMATAKWAMFDAGSPGTNRTKGIFHFYGPPENRPWGTRFTGGDYRGLSDLWRIPKASFWFVKAQWSNVPFVYIMGHWTWPGTEGAPRTVRIYSTCEEVELLLNGRSLGKRKPATTAELMAEWKRLGLWEPWFTPPEGASLRHAPFVWRNVPYEPGVLQAVGSKSGKRYIDERRTAGAAHHLILKADRNTIASGGRDSVRVVATVADKDGVMVPRANPWLEFRVEGPGDLLGTATLDAIWGMAAINVQSRLSAGSITVVASGKGLIDGRCTISSVGIAPGR